MSDRYPRPRCEVGFEEVRKGSVMYGTTDFVEVTDNFNFLFRNPADSGVRCFIHRVSSYNDAGDQAIDLLQNPDTNVPGSSASVDPTNSKSDAAGPNADFRAETATSAMSGGTATGDTLLSTQEYKPIEVLKDIPQGVSIGGTVSSGGGTLGSDPGVYMTVWWAEYPA